GGVGTALLGAAVRLFRARSPGAPAACLDVGQRRPAARGRPGRAGDRPRGRRPTFPRHLPRRFCSAGGGVPEHGYFYKGSMGTGGSLAVLRYNLEEMPSMTFSARVQLPAADPIAGAIVPAMARPPREAELESPVDPAEPAHRKLD